MPTRRRRVNVVGRLFAGIAGVALAWSAAAQQFHRQGFEGKEPVLKLGLTDGQIKLVDHGFANTAEFVHSGRQAEKVSIQATSGTFCFVEYPIEPAIVFEELSISAWINATKPGSRLAVRVVLPRVVEEKSNEPLTTILRGDVYEVANRWRRLTVRRPDLLLQQQQQLLQAQRKKSVDIRGAYVDMVLVDIFSGLGDVEVRVDDVQVGPIVAKSESKEPMKAPSGVPLTLRNDERPEAPIGRPEIRDRNDQNMPTVAGDQLRVGGRSFLMLGIQRTEAPLETLREAGINTVFAAAPIDQALANEATSRSMQIVPMLPAANSRGQVLTPAGLAPAPLDQAATGLAIFVGADLDTAKEPGVAIITDRLRQLEPGKRRPVAGEIREGIRGYSRKLDLVGVRKDPIFTSLSFTDYHKWLVQARRLARPGTFFWTWVQTHPPEAYARLVYGNGMEAPFAAPIGPQPEQIRLQAYAALAAGCRGLVYSSDRALSESAMGRDRMLQVALTNLELSLVEPFLAAGKAPTPLKTSSPNVAAAVFGHERGKLVIAYWNHPQAQYVVGQAAVNDLNVVVESAPEAAQAFLVSLADVRGVKRMKDLGGVRVVVPEFDTVAMVLLTTDMGLIAHYQQLVQQIGPQAAAWSRELAEIQLSRTEQIHARLESMGKTEREARGNLEEANRQLADSRAANDRGDHRHAILSSDRSRRVSRAVRQHYWVSATKDLPIPTTDPYAVSFFTLPERYQFAASVASARFSENKLPTGDFEREGNLDAVGWIFRATSPPELEPTAMLVGENVKEGRRSLELRAKPRDRDSPRLADGVRVEMVSPGVPVQAGQIVRVTGSIRLPQGSTTSVDGAMVYDSIGGETLALRFTNPGDWRAFSFVRPIQQSGELRVHLVMTGVGAACFDDLKVQLADDAPLPLAGREAPAVR